MTVLNSIAKIIINRIRENNRSPWFSDDEAEFIFQLPLIDEIRTEITPSDLEKLKHIVSTGREPEGNLALGSMKFIKTEGLCEYLWGVWNSTSSFDRRTTLLPMLLTCNPPLDQMVLIFEYTTGVSHRKEFFQKIPRWFSRNPVRILDLLQERLESDHDNRKWLYLYVALACEDKGRVELLLKKYQSYVFCDRVIEIGKTHFQLTPE